MTPPDQAAMSHAMTSGRSSRNVSSSCGNADSASVSASCAAS